MNRPITAVPVGGSLYGSPPYGVGGDPDHNWKSKLELFFYINSTIGCFRLF